MSALPGRPDAPFVLRNAHGLTVHLVEHGARIVAVEVPGDSGKPVDVVLGFDDPAAYEANADLYFGCTIGRVANRVAGARFTLAGREYVLAANDGRHHLHGGPGRAFDRVRWRGERMASPRGEAAVFHYLSPHLEEGYPGNLHVSVSYTLTDEDALWIEYRATTDEATPVSLTNHAYWNLQGAGAGTVLDHELTLFADLYAPTDDELIPTGEILPVDGTPLDFRRPALIGERIAALEGSGAHGYDHNFLVRGETGALRPAARLRDPASGRTLEVETTEPGLQLYTGNFLQEVRGKGGRLYLRRGGVCMETQHFPDALHHPNFPSIVLEPGQEYRQTSVYRLLRG